MIKPEHRFSGSRVFVVFFRQRKLLFNKSHQRKSTNTQQLAQLEYG